MNTAGKVVAAVIALFVLLLMVSAVAGVFALFGAPVEMVLGVWWGGAIWNTIALAIQTKKQWRSM